MNITSDDGLYGPFDILPDEYEEYGIQSFERSRLYDSSSSASRVIACKCG